VKPASVVDLAQVRKARGRPVSPVAREAQLEARIGRNLRQLARLIRAVKGELRCPQERVTIRFPRRPRQLLPEDGPDTRPWRTITGPARKASPPPMMRESAVKSARRPDASL
jgi:hypothetical protein